MIKRLTLLALVSMLIVSLAGCGSEPAPKEEPKAAAPTPKKEETAPVYDVTKESLTTHTDWTSKNVGILGTKIGDVTRNVQTNFGKLDNTRTLADEYLTIYQDSGLFVYTHKLTGKIRKYEVYDGAFSKKLADENLKKLLASGDLKVMRELFGQEDRADENAEDQSTEYCYDQRGFCLVKYKVNNKTVNALRFSELRRSTT